MDDSSILDYIDENSENYEPTSLKASKKIATKAQNTNKKKLNTKKRGVISDEESDYLSSTPPAAKKPKKSAVSRPLIKDKKALKPLTNINEDAASEDEVSRPANGKTGKSASETYQKISQEDHIMKRPDTYIGSIERTDKMMWIHDAQTGAMVWRNVSYVPGLYKIFDEIIVNAADNKVRDPSMDTVKVTLDRETNVISVYNNGKGLPIEIHKTEKIYIPQMIFGTLLTSSNYDDDEKKVTGGRNGFGAKLCNIFSKEFIIETADKPSKQKYKQFWNDNMTKCGKPKITTSSKGEEYTKVTFRADFQRFGMDGIDDDFEALVRRRVYDVAGSVRGLKVYMNGERVNVKNFKDYMQMHVAAIHREKHGDDPLLKKPDIVYEQVNDRWEVGFAVSDGSFQQVSFVNSIATTTGGTHVAHVSDILVNRVMDDLKKKKEKGLATLKPAQIKNHFFLFVNCLIENPAFTSQTKEQLTTKPSSFGSKCTLSDTFFKKLGQTELLSSIMDLARVKADLTLKKTDGSRRARINNPKLVDANKAGTKDGHLCTLILTEGDSAKSLAISGMEVVGRDLFGVFPLRGKLLNVRDASLDQIANNTEIQNIKQILGLQHKKHYEDTKSLRYGHLMIMTDQDHDGSHIKGLLINFLEAQYPSLLRIPGFLIEFITPIVKVYKGSILKPTKMKAFFTMPEYEYWKEHNTEKGWQQKYYKGLGTSSSVEAKAYFSDLDKHLKEFHAMKVEEQRMVDMVFSKKKTEERKEWLRLFRPGTYLDHSVDKISYDDFVNKELILYSMADNIRSIPSVIDGLKPGQRKVLFACFKRKLFKEIKVAQLAGYVSEHTHYQHGEQSLATTIIALAQNFVGSNNVNLLEPIGNFGTRLAGGKDASSPRYVNTMLSPLARALFPTPDDALLEYNIEDGDKIEPVWYAPILPLILVNGSEGIGTGWSSSIPNFNPEDVVRNIRHLLNDEELEPMTPWYRGFAGAVERIGPEKYQFSGIINQINDTSCEITELPVHMWTQEFKEKLDGILKPPEKSDKKDKKTEVKVEKSWIKDYLDYNTDLRVHFIVEMESRSTMDTALQEGLLSRFKLTKTAALSNMVAFDSQGRLMRYSSVDDILKEFYLVRLKLYQQRKEYVLNEMNKILRKLNNQARFIKMIISKELVVANKKRTLLITELKRLKFDVISSKQEAQEAGESEPALDEEDIDNGASQSEDETSVGDGYNYLLGMAIWSLTKEKVEKLLAEVRGKEDEIEIYMKKSPKDLWTDDLDSFVAEWHNQLEEERQRQTTKSALKKSRKVKVAQGKLAAKKLLTGKEGDSDEDFEIKPKKKPNKPIAPLKQTTLIMKEAKIMNSKAAPKFETLEQDESFIDNAIKRKANPRTAKEHVRRLVELSDDSDFEMLEDKNVKSLPTKQHSKQKSLFSTDSDEDDMESKIVTKPKVEQLSPSDEESDAVSSKLVAVKTKKPSLSRKDMNRISTATVKAKKAAPSRKAGTSASDIKGQDASEDEFDFDDSIILPSKKTLTPTKFKGKVAPVSQKPSRKVVETSEDEEEEDQEGGSDDIEDDGKTQIAKKSYSHNAASKGKAPASRQRRTATKMASYTIDLSDDENTASSDANSDSEQYSDASDD